MARKRHSNGNVQVTAVGINWEAAVSCLQWRQACNTGVKSERNLPNVGNGILIIGIRYRRTETAAGVQVRQNCSSHNVHAAIGRQAAGKVKGHMRTVWWWHPVTVAAAAGSNAVRRCRPNGAVITCRWHAAELYGSGHAQNAETTGKSTALQAGAGKPQAGSAGIKINHP